MNDNEENDDQVPSIPYGEQSAEIDPVQSSFMVIRLDIISVFFLLDNQTVHVQALIPPTFIGLQESLFWLSLLLGSFPLAVAYQLILICSTIRWLIDDMPIRFGVAAPFRERYADQGTASSLRSLKIRHSFRIEPKSETEFNVNKCYSLDHQKKNIRCAFSSAPWDDIPIATLFSPTVTRLYSKFFVR